MMQQHLIISEGPSRFYGHQTGAGDGTGDDGCCDDSADEGILVEVGRNGIHLSPPGSSKLAKRRARLNFSSGDSMSINSSGSWD